MTDIRVQPLPSDGEDRPTPFRLLPIGELELRPPRWLVKGLLEADALAVLFSEPNAGKSFLALDIAACIASATAFRDHAVTPGTVIYLAGESHNSIRRRIEAWQIRNGITVPTDRLYVSDGPAALCDEAMAGWVKHAVDAVASESGPPVLIVIDTLARNMGADENSTADMGRFVHAVDAIRGEHRATALIVHHVGHAEKHRARGSIALTGAADAEYRLEKDLADGTIRLVPTKMRDGAFPDPLAFRLAPVELGISDDDDQPVTSAVLDSVEYTPPPGQGSQNGPTLRAMRALEVLIEMQQTGTPRLAEWRERCLAEGIVAGRSSEAETKGMQRLVYQLRDAGLIQRGMGKGIWVPTETAMAEEETP